MITSSLDEKNPWWSKRSAAMGGATAVLLVMFALAVGSMAQTGPTFDEQGFITRGLGYLRGENRHMRVGHPLGLNALNALLLAPDEHVRLPTDDPSWQEPGFHRPSELFLWEIGNDVDRVMFLARLPTLWLGLLLAAVTGRWTWEIAHASGSRHSRRAGLLALILLALDPNILAHARLATTDLGLAAAATLAGYTLWRFLQRPSWSRAAIAGASFGLLQNTKFTALLFVPLFVLVVLINLRRGWLQLHRQSPLLMLIIAYPLAAFLTLWAAYGFQVGTLPANLPTFSQLAGYTLPLSHYLEQLLDIGGRLQKSTPAFLLGHYSDSGWWYYFPIAFLLKTPLPTLLLLAWAALARFMLRVAPPKNNLPGAASNTAVLLIPALGYFAIALTSEINLGYRHLLPVLPFLYVFAAVTLSAQVTSYKLQAASRKAGRSLLDTCYRLLVTSYSRVAHVSRFTVQLILLAWLALITFWMYPHYLAFFNVLAGGPENGWRALVDSNIDWGQDLGALKIWMDRNGVDHVWLSYFGEARPEYYGIHYTGLDSFPPRLMNPQARPFYPHAPAPGFYAISATNLQGVLFANPDQFAWFRAREPVAKIGYSIFVYQVPAHGEPAPLILSGIQLDELAPADFAQLQTNAVVPRWVDLGQSLLLPHTRQMWLAAAAGGAIHPSFDTLLAGREITRFDGPAYSLAHYDITAILTGWLAPRLPLAQLHHDTGQIELLAAHWETARFQPGTTLELATLWRQTANPHPAKIFIHALGPDGQLVTQWDGLGAAWEGWQAGDRLLQIHTLSWPPEAPTGRYEVWAGLYDAITLQRWQTDDGRDSIHLGNMEGGE